jgi:two-component system, LytTR family, response regulator LytT
MAGIKTLIVEDELIIAEDMKGMLEEMNHQVIGIASDCHEADEILAFEIPDIALIDIHLRGGDDGILLARSIREKHDIPIIFITSYSDTTTVDKAKQVNPDGYIVKPFEKADLYTSIEIAIFNYAGKKKSLPVNESEENRNVVIKDSIFIRKDYMLIKIRFEDLFWIRSEMNYLELFCRDAKHLIRSTLKDFVDKLPSGTFLQVHKSYCINTLQITAIDHGNVWLGEVQIPIGRAYLETVKKTLNLEI